MKTEEELNALKEEVETLNKKLAELTDDELTQVSGGVGFASDILKRVLESALDIETSGVIRVCPAWAITRR